MQVFRSKVISQSLRQSSTKAAAAEVPKLSYSERMAATGRPVSPHIFIYAWPITALTSITNRVTGGVLTIGNYLFTFVFLYFLFIYGNDL